jgi:hypothetical protein
MRPTKRNKRRGGREAECNPLKARSEGAAELEVSATRSEDTDETDEEKQKERKQNLKATIQSEVKARMKMRKSNSRK